MRSDTPCAGITVELTDARLTYDGRALFEGLRLTLPAASWTCLLGPSGVGKSTLLKFLAGLAPDHARGTVCCADGHPLGGRVAYMAQQDLLMPWLSVVDNVTIGARLRGRRPDLTRARALLAAAGLAAVADKRPDALSGGMRQRAALVRTLMEDRPVVLMDEPFSALDPITRLKLQELAAGLLRGRTVLLVTHDPMEALRLGDRLLLMTGSPAQLQPGPVPDGPPPRAPGEVGLLQRQAELLARLADPTGAQP